MKVLYRILILAFVLCVIYFATLGRDDFFRLVYAVEEVFQTIGNNYLRK